MYGICSCWNVDVYNSYVLCFQSGGGGGTKMQEEMVEANGSQINMAGKVVVVSKPLYIYIYFWGGEKIMQ